MGASGSGGVSPTRATRTSNAPRPTSAIGPSASRPLPSTRTTESPGASRRARACATSAPSRRKRLAGRGQPIDDEARARQRHAHSFSVRRPASFQRPVRILASTSGSRSRVTPDRTTRPVRPARARMRPRLRQDLLGEHVGEHQVEGPRRRGERPGVEVHPPAERVAAQVLPRDEDGLRVGVEAERGARAEGRRGERENARARPHVEDRASRKLLLLEGEEREPRRLVRAGAEGPGGRQAQSDPADRRLGVARVPRIDPEPPADRERAATRRGTPRADRPPGCRSSARGGCRGRAGAPTRRGPFPPPGRTRRDRGLPARNRGDRGARGGRARRRRRPCGERGGG